MKEYAQKTKQLARAIQESGRNQKVGFVDNRMKQNGHLDQIGIPSHFKNNKIIQEKRISISQLKWMGFNGPWKGDTWQWNDTKTGIHVTAIRKYGEDGKKYVTHFHVRKDTKGPVYNRIDYNENKEGDWIESNVNVPDGGDLLAQMRAIARETIVLIKGLVPPAG